jgi:FdhD protein
MNADVGRTPIDVAESPAAQSHLQEAIVAICLNGASYAVMLATPHELEDFARGFALSEMLIQHPDEIRDIHVTWNEQGRLDQGLTLDIALSPRAQHAVKERRRMMAGNTGCGLCGADAIAYALAAEPRHSDAPRAISASPASIDRARNGLAAQQVRNRDAGGGMHAAALFDADGNIIAVREDVGRHNALDKLIGASNSATLSNTYTMLTSRCSYELVLKCARAGIGTLVTFAMPTTLAVQCAQRANISLACYQGPQLRFYHHATRN